MQTTSKNFYQFFRVKKYNTSLVKFAWRSDQQFLWEVANRHTDRQTYKRRENLISFVEVKNAYQRCAHCLQWNLTSIAVYVVLHNHNVCLDRHSANKTSDQQMFAVKRCKACCLHLAAGFCIMSYVLTYLLTYFFSLHNRCFTRQQLLAGQDAPSFDILQTQIRRWLCFCDNRNHGMNSWQIRQNSANDLVSNWAKFSVLHRSNHSSPTVSYCLTARKKRVFVSWLLVLIFNINFANDNLYIMQ